MIKDKIKNCDIVCFDFDSTMIKYEGIDQLAKFKNQYNLVSTITKQAMGEGLSFRESLEKRLNIIKPRR